MNELSKEEVVASTPSSENKTLEESTKLLDMDEQNLPEIGQFSNKSISIKNLNNSKIQNSYSFHEIVTFILDNLQSKSNHGSKCPLIQTTNVDTGSITDTLAKQNDNLSQNIDPSLTTSLGDRDYSDSRQSSFEEYICYCNGSNTR